MTHHATSKVGDDRLRVRVEDIMEGVGHGVCGFAVDQCDRFFLKFPTRLLTEVAAMV